MAESVIDRLVVTLGLNPKDFGKGAQQATKDADKFTASIKKLGIDEAKLNTEQKKHLGVLRDLATQSERTKKELGAAGAAGKEFWGILEKGAAGFGAALGIYSLGELAKQAVVTNAALYRTGAVLGMSSRQADMWGKAIRESVSGSAVDALGTLQRLSRLAQMPSLGQGMPRELIEAAARSAAVSGQGMQLPWDASGKPTSIADFIHRISPQIRSMGLQKADAIWGGILDPGTLQFADLSDADQQKALAEAARNTPGGQNPYGEAQRAEAEAAKLADAFKGITDTLTLMTAPALTTWTKSLVAWIHYARGDITAAERDKQILSNSADISASDDAERAVDMMPDTPAATWFGRVFSDIGHTDGSRPSPRWSRDQRIARARQLLAAGVSADDIGARILQEEAAGGAPPAAVSPGASSAGVPSALLDAIRDRGERSGSNATSPAGARGRYQFMPATGAKYGLVTDADFANDAKERAAAAAYLSDLFAHFHDWGLASAAYNAGQGAVDSDVDQAKRAFGKDWRAHVGDFLPAETRGYISRVGGAFPGGFGALPAPASSIVVNGPTTINTKATDADGIKRDWSKHWQSVAQSQTGPS